MSLLIHDLRCEDGHTETSAVYRRSEGPSACPAEGCGKPRTVTYLPKSAGGGSALVEGETWVPLTFCDETFHTRSEWNAHVEKFARANNTTVDQVAVVNDTRYDKKLRADEARHRGWENRRRRGIDDQGLREWREIQSHNRRA